MAVVSLKINSIHRGDCVKLLSKVDAGSVDLVFADPPFNIGYEYDVYDDSRAADDYLKWCRQWIVGVYRALKPDGTFWLAIGDEFAAELKIESQKAGFHCRSWVIWYYTFGVNCKNGFSRSHTHLFHFVKDKKQFTFNRFNPQIRVKSARQLVYADNRANPDGRLPDNTWIIRPQDAPESFSPNHDTWYFARVAGTFKEREGFHGCQMPEQLLARIIRASSNPQDLVLDPFGGSGTTLCVAKKLGRRFMGFELSPEYAKYINERLARTHVGDAIDGPEDPIESAPSTANGKQKKKPFNAETEKAVIEAYRSVRYPADYIVCNPEVNAQFIANCLENGIGGSAYIWNRYLLQLRKSGKLPKSTQKPAVHPESTSSDYLMASEIAWRLLELDYQKSLEDILCSPEFANEFERLAHEFGANDCKFEPTGLRWAALTIRKRSSKAKETAASDFGNWLNPRTKITNWNLKDSESRLESPGAFVIYANDVPLYAGESENVAHTLSGLAENPNWQRLAPDRIGLVPDTSNALHRFALKTALAIREQPILNCRMLTQDVKTALV
ncbi:MAG: DNA methyltransferase [Pirellulaceae bacterium]